MTNLRLCALAAAVAVLGLTPNGAEAKSRGHNDSSPANTSNSVTEKAKSTKKPTTKIKLQDLSVTKKQDKASPQ